jgi:cytochrome c oxidase cbb3-type subunit 3
MKHERVRRAPPHSSHRRSAGLILAALGIAAIIAACQTRTSSLAAAASPPLSAFAMGPQPGPDRVLPPIENPYADDRAVLSEGRRLFNWYNCSGCHGDHAGGGMGPSLRDSLWYYGGDDAAIFASITEGRRHGMPAWGVKIPREQIWKLVTYIKSLRTSYEPDPPR